jgi:hypothetical protein
MGWRTAVRGLGFLPRSSIFQRATRRKFPPFREFADRRSADRSVRVLAMAGFSTQRDLLSTIAFVPFVRKINVIFLKTGERHLREMCLKIGHLRNGGSPRPKINHADMLYTLTPNI